jgi:hypothetical protein
VSRDPIATDDPQVFTVDYPIRPGVTEVEVAYLLPYGEKRLAYDEPVLYDLPRLDFFVQPADVQVEPQPPLQVVEVNDERNLVYLHGDAVAAGAHLALTLSGGSAVGGGHGQFQVAVQPNRTQKYLPFVALIVGGILLASAVLVGGKGRGNAAAAGAGDRQAVRLKENLLTSIAELDDRLAAGNTGRGQYEERRRDLMRKLEQVVSRLGGAQG